LRPNLTFVIGGALALAVVALFATGAEQRAVSMRRELLAAHASTAALSVGRLGFVPSDPEREAALLDLAARLQSYGEQDPRIARIGVLEATDSPTLVVLLAEWSRAGVARSPGTELDVRERPSVLRGLRETTVVTRADRLSAYVPLPREDGRAVLVAVDLDVADLEAHETEALRATMTVLVLTIIGFLLIGLGGKRAEPVPLLPMDATSGSGVDPGAPADAAHNAATPAAPDPREGSTSQATPPPRTALDAKLEDMERGQQEREFIREAFGRYMSLRVADAVSGQVEVEPAGEERQVSILALRFEWSLPLDGSAPAPEVVAVINAMLATANEVVDGHNGCVLDFSATNFVVSFGAPVRLPDHAERAVRCAVALRQRLKETVAEWQRGARPWLSDALRVQVGVAAGRVVAGSVGWSGRSQYTLVGEPVAVAQELEQLNAQLGTEILISETAVQAVPDGQIAMEDRGNQRVNGASVRAFSA
jgi:adenylate cyclase